MQVEPQRTQSKPTGIKSWHKSTQNKITSFIDDFLINYPDLGVRNSTKKLLCSLYKKASGEQKERMFILIKDRIKQLVKMGKASSEFLTLIKFIFQYKETPQQTVSSYAKQKKAMVDQLVGIIDQVFESLTKNRDYDFYAFCANMVNFDGTFQPYLIEANGCTRCYGKAENDFQFHRIDNILHDYKLHLNKAQFKLKRTYQIKNLKVNLKGGKLNFRQVTILYLDENGEKKLVGRYQKHDVIPPLSFTTSVIYMEFKLDGDDDYRQRRRNAFICWICGKQDDQSCYNCRRGIDIEGQFKVVFADPARLSSELSEDYQRLMTLRKYIEDYYQCFKNKKQCKNIKNIEIRDIENIYSKIMSNLQILSETRSKINVDKHGKERLLYKEIKNCFSCGFYQASNIIDFLKTLFTSKCVEFSKEQIQRFMKRVMKYQSENKIESLKGHFQEIIAALYLLNTDVQIQRQFDLANLSQEKRQQKTSIMFTMIKMYKNQLQKEKAGLANTGASFIQPIIRNQNIQKIKKLLDNPSYVNKLSNAERVRIFVAFMIPADLLHLLSVTQANANVFNNTQRLLMEEIESFRGLLNFNFEELYKCELDTVLKIFFKIIPVALVPYSNLQIRDPQFLQYIHTKVPTLQRSKTYQNVVFSPNPIISLNQFSILPHLIQKLKLQDAMVLIKQICKFRDIWNLSLQETLKSFNNNLAKFQKDKQLLFSLQAYQICQDPSFFERTYQLLVPQRMKFLIRMEVPEQHHRQQRGVRQGGYQYPTLPTKQVRSDDLQNQTMDGLRQWVAGQLSKTSIQMPFDLIVQGNIVDDLSLPIQVVFKKLGCKQIKKQIGKTTYYFFKAVYGIQGIYDANQRGANVSGDDKLDQCINCSAYLLERIPGQKNVIGLDLLMNIIGRLKSNELKKREDLFNILKTVFMNANITRKLVEEHYGDMLINQTMKFLNFSTKKDIERSELLLEVCSKTIDQANKELVNLRKKSIGMRKASQMVDENERVVENQNSVQYILNKIKQLQDKPKKNSAISQKMIKLLPFCSKDQLSASKMILDHFQVEKIMQSKISTKNIDICAFFDALEQGYMSVKTICKQNGLTKYIIEKIISSTQTNGIIDNEKTMINSETLEPIFIILKGLIKGNQMLQAEIFDKSMLPVLDHFTKIKIGKGKITTTCYEIIQYFKKGKMVDPRVKQFFLNREKATREIGSNKKNDILEKIRAKKNAAKKKLISQTVQYQEGQIHCLKCKLGYGTSKDIMGLYIYSTQIQSIGLQNWWKEQRKTNNLSSISYFSIIHYECHRQAFEQDRKNMKSEWQGAVVRNSQAKCNNWIPFKGPKTTGQQFDRVQAKYFEKNKNGNFWNVINDLNGLLYRFSIQYDFGKEGHGSSYSHNCQLIPVIYEFACHSMKRFPEDIKLLKEGVAYFDDHRFKKPNILRLFLTVNLFVENYQGFQKKKKKIWQGFEQIFGDKEDNFNEKKSDLVFLMMVNQIFEILHKNAQKEEGEVHIAMDKYIPTNFNTIVEQFQKLSQTYKTGFLKYQNTNEFKEQFLI